MYFVMMKHGSIYMGKEKHGLLQRNTENLHLAEFYFVLKLFALAQNSVD